MVLGVEIGLEIGLGVGLGLELVRVRVRVLGFGFGFGFGFGVGFGLGLGFGVDERALPKAWSSVRMVSTAHVPRTRATPVETPRRDEVTMATLLTVAILCLPWLYLP